MARAPRERAGGTARIAIIKVGSSTLTGDSGRIEEPYLVDLARQIHAARAAGWRVVLVSSGSIPAGLETLGLPVERPRDMPTVQAAASVGQRALLSAYDKVFTRICTRATRFGVCSNSASSLSSTRTTPYRSSRSDSATTIRSQPWSHA